MKTTTSLCTVLLLIHCSIYTFSQQASSCTNADFELNNFANWVGFTGDCCPVNTNNPGFVPGRHTIMSGAGMDPNSNGLIPLVPAGGGQHTARLGNDNVGSEAEKLSYTFAVTADNALFIYRYAVVLEDPSHGPADQPRFAIRVFDQNNLPVTCGAYDVVASANIPGFISIGDLRIKTWTTVGIELTSYIGQDITIEFTTADCGLGAHFGYAYMDAYCSPFQITSDFCPGSSVTNLGAPVGFQSYLWSSGDTTSSLTIVNPVLGSVYTCTMTSVTGCQVTLSAVLAPTNIISNFYTSVACANEVRFIDSTTVITGSPVIQWHWDFGDGTSSTLQNPVHLYPTTGNYNVTLITYNTGCSDTITKTISVLPVPLSDFAFVPQCPGVPVNFTDLSTYSFGAISQWEWNFGDGTPIVTTQNPSHTFSTAGPYSVTLVAEAINGCKDTLQKILIPFIPPDADFDYTASCANNIVDFTDISLYQCGAITAYYWDFDDGTPGSTLQNPTHIFPNKGIYDVLLVTTGLNGSIDSIVIQVVVPDLPVANFTASGACYSEQNSFVDQSNVNLGIINNWFWDFGDGSAFSGSPNAFHTYNDAGTYNTRLVVVSSFNCQDTLTKNTDVWQLPEASFVPDTLQGCEPLTVTFSSTSTSINGNLNSWQWDGGNSTSGDDPEFTTIYDAGTFNISLIITSSLGCRDTFTDYNLITAWPLPEVDFNFTPQIISIFQPIVNFTDISNDAVAWLWNINDHYTGVQNPQHVFESPGLYPVNLQVTSSLGCKNDITKNIEIVEEYVLYFPNAFTPNGDGKNDSFHGMGEGINDYKLEIFNRWGDKVWSADQISATWDGTYKSAPAEQGVYTYLANVTDINNKPYQLRGTVVLVK